MRSFSEYGKAGTIVFPPTNKFPYIWRIGAVVWLASVSLSIKSFLEMDWVREMTETKRQVQACVGAANGLANRGISGEEQYRSCKRTLLRWYVMLGDRRFMPDFVIDCVPVLLHLGIVDALCDVLVVHKVKESEEAEELALAAMDTLEMLLSRPAAAKRVCRNEKVIDTVLQVLRNSIDRQCDGCGNPLPIVSSSIAVLNEIFRAARHDKYTDILVRKNMPLIIEALEKVSLKAHLAARALAVGNGNSRVSKYFLTIDESKELEESENENESESERSKGDHGGVRRGRNKQTPYGSRREEIFISGFGPDEIVHGPFWYTIATPVLADTLYLITNQGYGDKYVAKTLGSFVKMIIPIYVHEIIDENGNRYTEIDGRRPGAFAAWAFAANVRDAKARFRHVDPDLDRKMRTGVMTSESMIYDLVARAEKSTYRYTKWKREHANYSTSLSLFATASICASIGYGWGVLRTFYGLRGAKPLQPYDLRLHMERSPSMANNNIASSSSGRSINPSNWKFRLARKHGRLAATGAAMFLVFNTIHSKVLDQVWIRNDKLQILFHVGQASVALGVFLAIMRTFPFSIFPVVLGSAVTDSADIEDQDADRLASRGMNFYTFRFESGGYFDGNDEGDETV